MRAEPRLADHYTLYGAEFSLYSGKLRSYLRKKGIPFVEKSPSVLTYKRFIEPRTGVRFIPVLHTPGNEVLQDTTAIIDALEPRFPEYPVYPDGPRQHLAALLLEVYGDEWLLIPAMHYRWNFPRANLPFIYDEFGRMAFPWLPRFLQRSLGKKLGRRFAGYLPKLGIVPKSEAAIEYSWLSLQLELNAHFEQHDYLFGGRPSIGDFGLIGPLYAHLYRDPYPGRLMREQAPYLAAWVERMQSPEPATGAFLADDEIPETIWPLLERMRREQVPVLVDTQRRLAEWHAENPELRTIPRMIGEHNFEIEGQRHRRAVLPHSLWRWQRCSDYLNGLAGNAGQPARDLAWRMDLYGILTAPTRPRVARENNRFIIYA